MIKSLVLILFIILGLGCLGSFAMAAPCDPVNAQGSDLTNWQAYNACVATLATGTGMVIASKSACTLASNSWTCNPSGYSIGTLTVTANQTINMGAGQTPGQFFTIRLTQDSTGGRVPTWGSMFLFQNSITNQPNTLIPETWPNDVEDILFQYDDAISKWEYLSRSSVQAISPTFQGNGTGIGNHPGNASPRAALALPANIETAVAGDNGGFEAGEGNGVYFYSPLQVVLVQFCNFRSAPTLAVFRCNLGNQNYATDQTAPVQVPAGGCTEFQVNSVAGINPSPTDYASYVCYINPGNSTNAYETWNSVYNEEVPSY